MSLREFGYITLAHRFIARFPFLSYLGIQINFWGIANLVLVTILSIQFRIINLAFEIDLHFGITEMLSIAILVGIFYGTSYGVLSNYFSQQL